MSEAEQLVDVDLPGGVTVKMPKDQADKVIHGRDELKTQARTAAERLGAIEAERSAAIAKAKEAEDRAAVDAAQKKGEFDKARELMDSGYKSKLSKVQERILDGEISTALSRVEGLVNDNGARDDLRRLLRTSCRYDVEADALAVVDAAGKPQLGDDGKQMSLEAYIRSFVDARPYLKAAAEAPGSGAAGRSRVPAQKQMKRDAYEGLSARERGAFLSQGGTLID